MQFAKSIVTKQDELLTRGALESFFKFIISRGRDPPSVCVLPIINLSCTIASNENGTSQPWFTIVNLYGGPDSQINARSEDFSAYPHRDALWVFQLYGSASPGQTRLPEGTIPFITDLTASLTEAQPESTFDAYINYVDPSLGPREAHQLYYGDELYEKLLRIKDEVDPERVYWNPQAIGA